MTDGKREKQKKTQVSRGGAGTSGGLVKLFYRIGEVAQIVGVAPHVLRYWESEFPTVKPQKSNHGQRVYTKRDVHKLLLIKHLLKDQGLTIAGARKQLRAPSSLSTLDNPVTSREHVSANDEPAAQHEAATFGPALEGKAPLGSTGGGVLAQTSSQELYGLPGQAGAPLSGPSSKSLRQALLHVRRELIDWLSDLQ